MKNFIISIVIILVFVGMVAGIVYISPLWASLALVIILQAISIIVSGTILIRLDKNEKE